MSEKEAAEEPSPPEVERLKSDLDDSRKNAEELLSRLKYLQADFENYKKRAARDMEATVEYATEGLITRMLPVLDEFDVALSNLNGEEARGLKMIYDDLLKVLQEAGLKEIQAEGAKFDPFDHEAVQKVNDSDLGEGMVKQVIQKGYKLNLKVIRPAKVVVVKKGDADGKDHRN